MDYFTTHCIEDASSGDLCRFEMSKYPRMHFHLKWREWRRRIRTSLKYHDWFGKKCTFLRCFYVAMLFLLHKNIWLIFLSGIVMVRDAHLGAAPSFGAFNTICPALLGATEVDSLWKGQSDLYFLRWLMSINICRTMLRILYQSVPSFLLWCARAADWRLVMPVTLWGWNWTLWQWHQRGGYCPHFSRSSWTRRTTLFTTYWSDRNTSSTMLKQLRCTTEQEIIPACSHQAVLWVFVSVCQDHREGGWGWYCDWYSMIDTALH